MEADPRRQKIPKDGVGPRGVPDCYHMPWVLKSTAHYEKFIKKLRATEKKQKQDEEEVQEQAANKYKLNFFVQSANRSLIKKAKSRVNYCLQSYEDNLNLRREKLKSLYELEEKQHIQKLVQDVNDGREAFWQVTQDRIAYLLDKRKKEHEAKYSSTDLGLSKCTHALPLLRRHQAQETARIWGDQVKEKQMRNMADKEIDNMWHAVLMKETEALSARTEHEVIERFRFQLEARKQTDRHLAMTRKERAKRQEMLKQETLQMLAKFKEDRIKEQEEKRQLLEIHRKQTEDIHDMIKVRKETVARQKAKAKVISDTWNSLTNQGIKDDYREKQRRIQHEREMGECNLMLAEQKKQMDKYKVDNLPLIQEEYQRRADAAHMEQEHLIETSRRIEKETMLAIGEQLREKELARRHHVDETAVFKRQVSDQLDQLVKHKQLTDRQAQKLYFKDVHGQRNYNKMLKERARREAEEQAKKCEIADKEFQEQIQTYRSKYGDVQHPFMKHISNLSKSPSRPSGILPNIF